MNLCGNLLKPWVLGNLKSTFVHNLCIDNIFSRLNFECSDGCFPKSTSLAQRHIDKRCCVVQAPSNENVKYMMI